MKTTQHSLNLEKIDLDDQIAALTNLINASGFTESLPYVPKLVKCRARLGVVNVEIVRIELEIEDLHNIYYNFFEVA